MIHKPAFYLSFTPRQKEKIEMKTNTFRKAGFTLVEIMIVVAIIALLAAIAIPNFVKARTTSQKSACIANLKQIDGAKATWALETKQVAGAAPTTTDLYGTTKYIRDEPTCPGGGVYVLTTIDTKPTCNITGHTL